MKNVKTYDGFFKNFFEKDIPTDINKLSKNIINLIKNNTNINAQYNEIRNSLIGFSDVKGQEKLIPDRNYNYNNRKFSNISQVILTRNNRITSFVRFYCNNGMKTVLIYLNSLDRHRSKQIEVPEIFNFIKFIIEPLSTNVKENEYLISYSDIKKLINEITQENFEIYNDAKKFNL